MICLVLGVYLLPDIYLSGVGPSGRVVLRHEPECREVAYVRSGAQTALNASVCEVHLVRAFNGTADHVHVALFGDGVLDAACDELAVAYEGCLLLSLSGLRGEALPCRTLACAVVPYVSVRQRVVLAVELVSEAQLVLLCAVSLEQSRHAHITVHLSCVDGEVLFILSILHLVFLPLTVAVDVLLSVEVVTVTHGDALHVVAGSRSKGHEVDSLAKCCCFCHTVIVVANDMSATCVDVELAVIVVHVQEEVDDVAVVVVNVQGIRHAIVASRVDVVLVYLQTSAINTGRQVVGDSKRRHCGCCARCFAVAVLAVIRREANEFAANNRLSGFVEWRCEHCILIVVDIEICAHLGVASECDARCEHVARLGVHFLSESVAINGSTLRDSDSRLLASLVRNRELCEAVGCRIHLGEVLLEVERIVAARSGAFSSEVDGYFNIAVDIACRNGELVALCGVSHDSVLLPLAQSVYDSIAVESVSMLDAKRNEVVTVLHADSDSKVFPELHVLVVQLCAVVGKR